MSSFLEFFPRVFSRGQTGRLSLIEVRPCPECAQLKAWYISGFFFSYFSLTSNFNTISPASILYFFTFIWCLPLLHFFKQHFFQGNRHPSSFSIEVASSCCCVQLSHSVFLMAITPKGVYLWGYGCIYCYALLSFSLSSEEEKKKHQKLGSGCASVEWFINWAANVLPGLSFESGIWMLVAGTESQNRGQRARLPGFAVRELKVIGGGVELGGV